jgi:hypothetical protein
MNQYELFTEYDSQHLDIAVSNLPDDLSGPTWWLIQEFQDGNEWMLVNYKEKKIIDGGYDPVSEPFAKTCAEFGFEVLSWATPSVILGLCFY